MRIAVACDHAGFPMKETVIEKIREAGHEPLDLGAYEELPGDDYPDYAVLVGQAVLSGKAERGILVCGSGVGVSIAASKIEGIYAGVCHDTYSAHQGVEHDNMNVLCLGARVIGPDLAEEVVKAFLGARFSGEERHRRRVEKIRQIESRE